MDKNETLLDYIRANRTRYNRRAIDKRLGEQGYTFAEIEAAWQQVLSEDGQAGQQTTTKGGSASSCTIPILVLFGFLLVVLTNLGFAFDAMESRPDEPTAAPLQWFVNVGSLVVLALVVATMIVLAQRGWPSGKIVGLVTVVAAIWYLIVAGSCLYGMNAY